MPIQPITNHRGRHVQGGREDLHGIGSAHLRDLRRAAVDGHRAQHGGWCPGWDRPAHPSDDLTADHVVPVALGGDPAGPFAVLCRSCNGRKGKHGSSQVRLPAVRSRDWL